MAVPPAYHESLPYIDDELSPAALSAAHALIAAEQQAFTPSAQPSSSTAKEPSFSPAIQQELDRISSSASTQPLDLSRYEAQELPEASSSASLSIDELSTPLQNSYISSSYLSSRSQALSLLNSHGKNAWLLGNYHLEAELRSLERELADTKRDIDLTNAARAQRQNDVKGEMQGLEQTWRRGVGRVLETEIAVEELREQIREELRRRSAPGGAVADEVA